MGLPRPMARASAANTATARSSKWRLKTNGRWKEAILHRFTAGSDGAFPCGVMVLDQSGNLYGTLLGENGLSGSGVF